MRLFIAEKPSLGRAIADVLPRPHKKGEGYIEAANGDVVSWCIGHLLEQAEPDAYDPAYKQWRLEHLPIVPEQWVLEPKAKTRKQLTVLRKLVKSADQLVHAGDPDREGQLLVDEVFGYLKVPEAKKKAIQRCLISDLNPAAVKRALASLRSNTEFLALSVSALARSRADWLYGLNMTRAYTIQGRNVGYNGVLSVGRVQTPVLGLVVERDRAIESFQPKPFYDVWAIIETDKGERFKARWIPSEACRPYQDDDGRVLSRPLAENVARRIEGQPAKVVELDKQLKKQNPPLPYNLSALQIDAAKRFSMSAKEVLDTCQSLYEKHKLITYPRSDSRHLPTEHFAEGADVISAIAATEPALAEAAANADSRLRSKAWNDSKVDAHHAIIPTRRQLDLSRLSKAEQQIYQQVARQYLAQFYPQYRFNETKVKLEIAGGLFGCKATEIVDLGWKTLFPARKEKQDEEQLLPPLSLNQMLQCVAADIQDKMTQPPKYFTDATLLAAMTGIARFVTDPEIRKVLRDTDGLGTEATRAGIIELLFKRSYLKREGKAIRATAVGRGLIDSLPAQASRPDMTAQWESMLESICQRQLGYNGFMEPLQQSVKTLISDACAELPLALKGVKSDAKPAYRRKRSTTGKKRSTSGGAKSGRRKKAASSA